jgi:inorganic pyrophosphatase
VKALHSLHPPFSHGHTSSPHPLPPPPFHPRALRDVQIGSSCNYGAIPQTWEDPEDPHPDTGYGGDNDPVDVLQINAKPCEVGDIQTVRVLGTLALIDDDETDWKLLVVDITVRDTL